MKVVNEVLSEVIRVSVLHMVCESHRYVAQQSSCLCQVLQLECLPLSAQQPHLF
jgi:hypothetical protein